MILRFFLALFLVLFSFLADSRHKAHAETSPKVQDIRWGDSLIVSIPGTVLDKTTVAYLEKIRPSGILLFRRNIKTPSQTQSLIESLQQVAIRTKKSPYLMLVDQEGGIVTRIHSNPPPPSLLALAQVKNPQILEEYATATGMFLRSLGFHIVLAPVADIDDPNRKSFLGHRVASKDTDQVIETLLPMVEGYSLTNVLPTLKHFPGHGFLKDSHHERAIKNTSLTDLWDQDLAIYKEFSEIEVPYAILTSHISLPTVDPTKTPTTYSKKIVSGLLRKELNFNGLVISDDIEMGGALSLGLYEKIRLTTQAGHDLVIVTSSLPVVAKAVDKLEKNFKEFNENDLASQQRRQKWMKYFEKFKIEKRYAPLLKNLEDKIVKINRLIFETSWKEMLKKRPLENYSADSWTVASSDPQLIQSFTQAKADTRAFLLGTNNVQRTESFLAKQSGPVLFHVSGEKTAKLLLSFSANVLKKILVLNSYYPGALNKLPESVQVLNLSTPMPLAGLWTAEHIDLNLRQPASANSTADLGKPGSKQR